MAVIQCSCELHCLSGIIFGPDDGADHYSENAMKSCFRYFILIRIDLYLLAWQVDIPLPFRLMGKRHLGDVKEPF